MFFVYNVGIGYTKRTKLIIKKNLCMTHYWYTKLACNYVIRVRLEWKNNRKLLHNFYIIWHTDATHILSTDQNYFMKLKFQCATISPILTRTSQHMFLDRTFQLWNTGRQGKYARCYGHETVVCIMLIFIWKVAPILVFNLLKKN